MPIVIFCETFRTFIKRVFFIYNDVNSHHVDNVNVTGGSFRVGTGRAHSGRRTRVFLRIIECKRSLAYLSPYCVPPNAIEKSSRRTLNSFRSIFCYFVVLLTGINTLAKYLETKWIPIDKSDIILRCVYREEFEFKKWKELFDKLKYQLQRELIKFQTYCL